VHVLGWLGWSRRFAATLNAARRPFHALNYVCSCGGGPVLSVRFMSGLMDRVV